MKFLKLLALVCVAFSLVFISSCGKKGGSDDPTDQELAITALTSGTWNYDDASTVGNGVLETDITVTLTKASESTVNFAFGGDLAKYASGGTLTISESGAVSAVTVTIAATTIELDGTASGSLTGLKALNIKFSTTAAGSARTSGTGSFDLTFNKAE